MTMNSETSFRSFSLPAIEGRTLATVATAGAFATIAFDLFGQGLSPLLGYAKLAPVGLAKSTLNVVFGLNSGPAAYILHTFTGVIAYVIGWMFIVQPLAQRFAPQVPWWATAAAYGVALWVFALYIMAHLVAGMPAFLGFSGITWVALWGHIVYALVMAGVIRARS